MTLALQLQLGGTLNPRQHIYIERDEDEKFFHLLEQGEYVNVLSSRQMGKSSLMMRAVQRLGERGIKSVTIDLASELGTPPDLDAFYLGLLSKIVRVLALQLELKAWWDGRGAETVNQRLLRFFSEIIGGAVSEPVVIFLDEIDSTLKLAYTDDLFTAIRGMYNDRPMVEPYRRITFCLLGVATPNELIKNRRTTAYNVGTPLALRDFERSSDDLSPFVGVLHPDAAIADCLLDRILYWSGGQPYLTQKLCSDIIEDHIADPGAIDRLVTHGYENLGQASNDVHFQQILRFLEDRLSDGGTTIDLYAKVLSGAAVPDRTTLASTELKLSGLVKRDNKGNLEVRNKIYRRLFDHVWVQRTRPRQALKLTRNLAYAASIAFVLLLAGGVAYYVNVVRPAQIRLQTLERLAELKISITDGKDGAKAKLPEQVSGELIKRAIPLLKAAGRITEIESALGTRFPAPGKELFVGEIDDLTPFSELDQLQSLNLTGLKLKELGSLVGLEKLRILRIGISPDLPRFSNTKLALSNIASIRRLANLERLSIAGTSVFDLEPVSLLGNLRELDISGTDIGDLKPLKGHEQLESLAASKTPITDLHALTELKSIKVLILDQTSVSDVSPLSELSKVQELSLFESKVTDISSLSAMRHLKVLRVSQVDERNLEFISGFSDLTDLFIGKVVEDISPLRRLTRLEILVIAGGRVRDVSPLQHLSNLTTLGLLDTQITDVRPLAALTGLQLLVLESNDIPVEQLKWLREKLRKTQIETNEPSIPAAPLEPESGPFSR